MRIWNIPLLAALWLSGCASHGTIYRDRLSTQTAGRTLSATVKAAWRPPWREITMQDGRHVLIYQYLDTDSENGTFGATRSQFGPIGSTTTPVTGQVRLTFGPQGVLLDHGMYGQS